MPLAAITFDPALPVWLMAVLVLAALAVTWAGLRRAAVPPLARWALLALRTAALLLLAWLALLPEWRDHHTETDLPVLALAVDLSASMTDRPKALAGTPTRAEQARAFLDAAATRRRLEQFQLWRTGLGDGLEEGLPADPARLTFTAGRSALGAGLNTLATRLQGQNAAGILLLSDGLDSSGEPPGDPLLRTPVFCLELEPPVAADAAIPPDAWIADLAAPRRVVVGWDARVDLLVRRRGGDTGPAVMTLKLLRDGKEENREKIEFAAGETFRQAAFTVTPKEQGHLLWRVELETPPGDSLPDNNAREFVIEVTDPQNRVLYLEGAPRWEFKYLKRALQADKNLMLEAYALSGAGGFVSFQAGRNGRANTPPALTREGLAPYKVVIIGNLPAGAPKPEEMKALAAFAEAGGGLLLAGGPDSFSAGGWVQAPDWRDLLPAHPGPAGAKLRDGRFTVTLTPAGKTHPATQGLAPDGTALPPLLSLWSPAAPAAGGMTLLATAADEPALAVRRYGQGRVALLLSDSFWRWQLGDAESAGAKSAYARLMTQLVAWLAPAGRDSAGDGILQLLTSAAEVETRQQVTVGALIQRDGQPVATPLVCQITGPNGQRQTLDMASETLGTELGLLRPTPGRVCEFTPETPGRYDLQVVSRDGVYSVQTLVLVQPPRGEITGAPANRAWLQELARATGGRYATWDDREALLAAIPCQPRERQVNLEEPLWPKTPWLLLALACLCTEWWWRRKLRLT